MSNKLTGFKALAKNYSLGASTKDKVAAVENLKAFMLADPVRGVNIREIVEEGRA